MKKLIGLTLCLFLIVLCAFAIADVAIDKAGFPDITFRKYIKENCDTVTVTAGRTISEPTLIDISTAKITTIRDQVYTGKKITPKITVKIHKQKLVRGSDYTVSYKNNKAIGTATATIKGINDYTGTVKVTFVINPKAVSLSSLKAGKSKLTVKWQKGRSIDGYEIQYSTKKNFKNAKTANVTKAETTSKEIKKLKNGKTYYVRIRAFKTVKGTRYYSTWSAIKKTKVK